MTGMNTQEPGSARRRSGKKFPPGGNRAYSGVMANIPEGAVPPRIIRGFGIVPAAPVVPDPLPPLATFARYWRKLTRR